MENVVKVDSKGRILIPARLRKKMGIETDSELVVIKSEEEKQLRIMPLSNGKTVKCRVSVSDSPGGLLSVMELLEMLNVNVLMSESVNFMGNGTSEWMFILDISQLNKKPAVLQERLSTLGSVKSVSVSGESAG